MFIVKTQTQVYANLQISGFEYYMVETMIASMHTKLPLRFVRFVLFERFEVSMVLNASNKNVYCLHLQIYSYEYICKMFFMTKIFVGQI